MICANSLHSKNIFYFAPPDSSDRPSTFLKTHTPNSNALRLLGKRVKRSLFIYMAISFHSTYFCPNFSQNSFFFLPTIYNFLSYTLLTLRFGEQICLNLSASRSQSSWTSQAILQAILPHVTLLSHMSISFPVRHQTSSIKEEQLQRMLLHKRLPSFLTPYSTDMTIY